MKIKSIFSTFIAASILAAAQLSNAATYTWSGAGFMGSQDFLWSNPFNWTGLGAPQTGETNVIIIFPNNASPRNTTNDVAGLVIKSIEFQGDNYLVAGKSPGTALTLSRDRLYTTLKVTGNNCQFVSSFTATLVGDVSIDVAAGKNFATHASFTGSGGFTKLGVGNFAINSAGNNYNGVTDVQDGIVDLQTGLFGPTIAIPSTLTIGGTNLIMTPVVRLLNNDQIADDADVIVNLNAKLWLNTFSDTIGSLTMAGGLVNTGQGGSQTSPGTLTLSGNVTNLFTGVFDVSTISGKLNLGTATRVFDVASSSQLAIDASISGNQIVPPGLIKSGPGLLTLFNATNTYGGTTWLNDGGLKLSGSSQLLGTTNSGTVVAANAQLQLAGVAIGAEPLTLNGGSIVTLAYSGTNSWAGPISLLGNSHVQGDETDELTLSGIVSGTGGLTKQGDGVLWFKGTAPNTFSGGLFAFGGFTEFSKSASASALAGPLVVGTSNAPQPSIFVDVNSSYQIPANIPITILHGTLAIENGAVDTLGNIEFVGGWLFNDTGTFTLSGNISNRLADVTAAIYGEMNLAVGPHFFHADSGASFDVLDRLNGNGAVTKTGPGAFTYYSANTYTGLTLVKDGNLRCVDEGCPGSSGAATEVESGGLLLLDHASITNELLILHGHPVNYSVYVRDQSTWAGPVSLLADSGVQFEINNGLTNRLSILGAITGAGGLRSDGEGELLLGGNADNTFAGQLWIRTSEALFQKVGGSQAVTSSLRVGNDSAPPNVNYKLRLGAHNQIGDSTPVEVLARGIFDLNTYNDTIGALTLSGGTVFSDVSRLTLNGNVTVHDSAAIYPKLSLGGVTRLIATESTSHLSIYGSVEDGSASAGMTLNGGGGLSLYGSNSFSGTLTLQEGDAYAFNSYALGKPSGPTWVMTNAYLWIINMGSPTNPVAEPIHFADTPGNEYSLRAYGSNYLSGPIELMADFSCSITDTNDLLVLSGLVSGAGTHWRVDGPGTLRLAGTNDNTFAGELYQAEGRLELAKSNALAVAGSLIVGNPYGIAGDVIARWFQSNQVADSSAVLVGASGQLELQNYNETIGSLSGWGNLLLGSAALTTGGDGTSTEFAGFISGIGGQLIKMGAGTMTLSGNNSYTGGSTVYGGTLLVNGQQPQSPVSLMTGGQVGGNGRVGNISAIYGNVSPGASPGKLACGNFSFFGPSSLLKVEIAGTTPGVSYDQVDVNGSVLLMGGALQVSMNFSGAVSNQYVIVKNDNSDLVNGTFTGLPNGSSITNNGVVFVVKYDGGDGNDIVLIQQNVQPGPKITGIRPIAPGHIQIDAAGWPNLLYNVQATTNLNPPAAWSTIGSATADGSGLMTFVDPNAGNFPMRFYRFVAP